MENSTKDWIYDLYVKETINRKIKLKGQEVLKELLEQRLNQNKDE